MEGKNGVPLRYCRPIMAVVGTGIVAVSIGLPAAPASADQVRQSEYWLRTLHVTSAWAGSRGSGVTVAVLSDGVNPSQPDLTGSVTPSPAPAGAPIASGQYFGEQGTAIAGLIAGHGHGPGRGAGIIGVAPLARILSVPVTLPADDPELSQTAVAAEIPAAIAAGIRYAVDHGATVIDLPIDPSQPGITGTGAAAAGDSAAEQSAVAYALRHNAVLVAPAGDDGAATDAPNYPAAYHGVIAVGAFNEAFDKAAWSSHQSYVTVTAAGAGVIAASGTGYQTMNSTSAASAVVSGVVALIRASYPQLTVAEVRKALITSTLYRRSGGLADGSGYGAVDADTALAAAGQLATSPARPGRRRGAALAVAIREPGQPRHCERRCADPAGRQDLGRRACSAATADRWLRCRGPPATQPPAGPSASMDASPSSIALSDCQPGRPRCEAGGLLGRHGQAAARPRPACDGTAIRASPVRSRSPQTFRGRRRRCAAGTARWRLRDPWRRGWPGGGGRTWRGIWNPALGACFTARWRSVLDCGAKTPFKRQAGAGARRLDRPAVARGTGRAASRASRRRARRARQIAGRRRTRSPQLASAGQAPVPARAIVPAQPVSSARLHQRAGPARLDAPAPSARSVSVRRITRAGHAADRAVRPAGQATGRERSETVVT